MDGLFARECLLTDRNIGTSTITQSQGGCTTQKLPMKLRREEQCVVRSEKGCILTNGLISPCVGPNGGSKRYVATKL